MQRSMASFLTLLLILISAKGDESNLLCEDDVCTQVSNQPVIDPCHDTHVECEFWASIGECDINPNYMLDSCAKSCGLCPLIGFENHRRQYPAQSLCVDEEKISECERRAKLGECVLEPDFMKQHCKATCIYCINEEKLRLQGVSDDEIERRFRYLSMNRGENQGIFGKDPFQRYHNVEQIKAMETYSKTTVLLDDCISPSIRNKCTNSIDKCAYYASKGMCESSNIFMMNNCPLACMMCESLEEFHALVGKLHPFENPLFVKEEIIGYIDNPQEINVFSLESFFNVTKDNLKDNIQVISQPTKHGKKSNDPFVVLINNFLSGDECDRLIQLGHDSAGSGWHNSTVSKFDNFNGMYSFQTPFRFSESLMCDPFIIHDANDNNNDDDNNYSCTTSFNSLLTKLSQALHIPENYFEFPQMDRYPPGGYYSLHHDYRISDSFKPHGPRILSIYLFLSEAASGGMMGFPDLDFLLIRPKRGSILLVSNVQGKDLSFQRWSRKEIMPVRNGELYLVHTHVHLHAHGQHDDDNQ